MEFTRKLKPNWRQDIEELEDSYSNPYDYNDDYDDYEEDQRDLALASEDWDDGDNEPSPAKESPYDPPFEFSKGKPDFESFPEFDTGCYCACDVYTHEILWDFGSYDDMIEQSDVPESLASCTKDWVYVKDRYIYDQTFRPLRVKTEINTFSHTKYERVLHDFYLESWLYMYVQAYDLNEQVKSYQAAIAAAKQRKLEQERLAREQGLPF